ncbi:MAG: RluA family pseudouridine synthase [Lachnospiraceae bacterium]
MYHDLKILLEDQHVIVLHKPAGLAVQSARISSMDLQSQVKNYLNQKTENYNGYLGIIHRLDQPVEGVVLFAKTAFAAKELSAQITSGRMHKIYLAGVQAKPSVKSGRLEHYLLKKSKENCSMAVPPNTQGAKKALLEYTVLQSKENEALLRIELLTGRHHQIRVQLSQAGMPIVGDTKYSMDGSENPDAHLLALCASELRFAHPKTKQELHISVRPQNPYFTKFDLSTEKN